MRRLNNRDLQQIDNEIMGRIGRGTHHEVITRLRDIAEMHRVYASRAANMCSDLHDERLAPRIV